MDAQSPTNTPAKTAATTSHDQANHQSVRCADCQRCQCLARLTQVWILGRPTYVCSNPWDCWGAQAEVRHALAQVTTSTDV